MASKSLKVTIRSRETLLFDGSCTSLTSYNEVGEFDILDKHANFITLIKNFVIVDKDMPTEKEISITSGVMQVGENTITAYIDPVLGAEFLEE